MPAADIRFIHDARKPAELKALFAACNNGEVSVLIGSTEKMGTGMNVQARTAGLHHVDVPWRPADLEQREGRIRRQGNQNQVVDIVTYVSEGTYDVVMWQKVQAKALFIEQMRRNEVLDVEIEDLSGGDIGSAAAETKAIATGDPRYIRQVELDDEITKLSALQRAHNDAIRQRDWRVGLLERAIPKQHEALARIAPHVERAQQHAATETSPAVAVDGRVSSDRATTATSVAAACRQAYHNGKEHGATRYEPTGITVNGVDVLASRSLMHDMLLLRLAIPSRTTEIKSDELVATQASGEPGAAKARGLHRRVENLYTMLPTHQASLQRGLDGDQAQLDDMLANPPQPFEHSDALDAKKAELAALTLQLRLDAESPEAKQKAQDAADRLTMRGREPGWTLLRNATPAVLEETGCATADVLRRMITARERMAIADYYRDLDDGTPGLDHEL
jgi:hypothetical protein